MSDTQLFEHQAVRRHWDAVAEKWYFSVIDVVAQSPKTPAKR
jgi:hypothetical protein